MSEAQTSRPANQSRNLFNDLDESFAKLLGRQPSDSERQKLYVVRDALGLENNDALWLVLMALQHYQTQYEAFPAAISQAAKETLFALKETADATMRMSANDAKADLAAAVASSAQTVAKMSLKSKCGNGPPAVSRLRFFASDRSVRLCMKKPTRPAKTVDTDWATTPQKTRKQQRLGPTPRRGDWPTGLLKQEASTA